MGKFVCTGPGGRGCPCPHHVRQRGYNRRYDQRQREAILTARRMSARTCPRMFNPSTRCGAVLDSVIVEGRVVVVCPMCERYERGICGRCPRPVAGTPRKSRWCAEHKREVMRESRRKWRTEHRTAVNAHRRELYANDPSRREQGVRYSKGWRNRNPEAVKRQDRRKALKQSPKRLAYLRRYWHETRDVQLARLRDRQLGIATPRTCCVPGCDIVVTGRKKKCTRCKQRDAMRAAA